MVRKSWCRAAGVVAASAWLAQPACAFYFAGWPGSGVPPRVSIFSPAGHTVTLQTQELFHTEKPTGGFVRPPEVPEPLSLTLVACGLAAVGAWRWRRADRRISAAGESC